MTTKTYFKCTAIVFGIIALLHAARLGQGWSARIDGYIVPMQLSWVAMIVSGYLSYWGFKLGK